MITIDKLTVGYGGSPVLEDLSLQFPGGKVSAIIGPNGCGKSTLLRAICRLLQPASGKIVVDGVDAATWSQREFAQQVALLPQHPEVPAGLTVAELVARGRYPYQGFFGRTSATDREKVAWALQVTDTAQFRDRPVASLSGGQRQRVWLALTLAQDTAVLVLDEPTTYLDLAHQLQLADLIAAHAQTTGTTVVMVLHELGIAARVADHLVALKDGKVVASGSPSAVLTPAHCREIFDFEAVVLHDERVGHPVVAGAARKGVPWK